MYTIKQAALRAGISLAVLRAWERRYGIVSPERTTAGYRLYDDDTIARVRHMRRLVESGWAPSHAAAAIRDAEERGAPPPEPGVGASRAGTGAEPATGPTAREPGTAGRADPSESREFGRRAPSVEAFVSAAAAFDHVRLEAVLDEMFATGSLERVLADALMPALRALGDAWAAGALDVAAEHAASNAVLRRLAAAYQAAAMPPSGDLVLVALPPGARHELGALAFAVVARRAGIAVLYLGADLPAADWVRAAVDTRAAAAVIGAVGAADASAAEEVAEALHAALPDLLVALGGSAALEPAAQDADWRLRLPSDDLGRAAADLRDRLAAARPAAPRQAAASRGAGTRAPLSDQPARVPRGPDQAGGGEQERSAPR